MNKEKIQAFVNEFDKSIIEYEAYYYGYEEIADGILDALLRGTKRATTGLYRLYKLDNEELPKVGEVCVVLDSKEEPYAITRITKVEIVPFDRITEEYAFIEGEGDRSLEYWTRCHREVFIRECKEYHLSFLPDELCVCEYFEVLYQKNKE